MTKIERIDLCQATHSVQVAYKLNEITDAVNKLQEDITIASLLLQVSQQQEAIDDLSEQVSQLWNT